MKPRLSVVTLFPEFFEAFRAHSIVGRGVKNGAFDLELVDLRQWGIGAYQSVDDYSYGGDGGMTLRADVLEEAYQALCATSKPFVVYPTPQGAPLTQDLVESLPREGHMALFCGHYEGLDERFVRRRVDLEVSVGDYVLTGGELPAMTIIDAWSRLLPGVVGNSHSVEADSFYDGMLDTCHYTRPPLWKGDAVPEVLLSGDTALIQRWRRDEALARTLSRRPDLLARASLSPYLHHRPTALWVTDQLPDPSTLRGLDGLAQAFGLTRFFLCPATFDKACAEAWKERVAPLGLAHLKIEPHISRALTWLKRKTGATPLVAHLNQGSTPWLEAKRIIAQIQRPLVLVLGSSPEADDLALRPLCLTDPNDPVALMAISLDRFFGSRS